MVNPVLVALPLLGTFAAAVVIVIVGLVRRRRGVSAPACARCRYEVEGLDVLRCPECGADLREAGILTPGTSRPLGPVGWLAAWTLALPLPATLITWLVWLLLPSTYVSSTLLQLTPRDVLAPYERARIRFVGEGSLLDKDPDHATIELALPDGSSSRPLEVDLDNFRYRVRDAQGDWQAGAGPLDADGVSAWLTGLCGTDLAGDRVAEAEELHRLLEEMSRGGPAAAGPAFTSATYSGTVSMRGHLWFQPAAIVSWLIVWIGGGALIVQRLQGSSDRSRFAGVVKIVIPGGRGQVGTILARAFHARGDEVVVLSRRPGSAPWRVTTWDGEHAGPWTDELDGADVVVNLAGRSVNCRYHAANRRAILDSRVVSTRLVGEAIAAASRPPRTWLQAGTATIYAHRYDAANDEATGLMGGDEPGVPDTWRFSIDAAKAWERQVDAADTPRTRRVKLRSAMIMSPDRGGVFDTLLTLVRRGLGGRAGDGRQYVSWIHETDFVRAVDWLLEREDVEGVVNVAAPNPLPNERFMGALREAAGVRVGLPATRWMLEVGAVFLRTETELVLKSRRVVPGRLIDHGFAFEWPTWPEAARDLCAAARRSRSRST